MENYVVATYYSPHTLEGSYGHHRNPYNVSFHVSLCDARELAYCQAQDKECIEDSMVSEDLYKCSDWSIRVMSKKRFQMFSKFTWDKDHADIKGAYKPNHQKCR